MLYGGLGGLRQWGFSRWPRRGGGALKEVLTSAQVSGFAGDDLDRFCYCRLLMCRCPGSVGLSRLGSRGLKGNEGFRASVFEEMLRMASDEELRQGDFGCDIELVRDRIFFRWCWSALVVDDQ